MRKQKSSAQIHVADGAGGMRQVADLRFEAGEWPIEFVVPATDAETWMAHLNAETEDRGWNSDSFSQLDAGENSGTIAVHTATGPSATLDSAWERPRGKALRLRARPNGDPVLSLQIAQDFINAVSERLRTIKSIRAYRQALLTYDGLPWRGELWLDADHRLGPPSKHRHTLLGPQIVIVDAMIEGIGQQGVTAAFQRSIHELRVSLSFVLGLNITISKIEFGWVSNMNAQGSIMDCTVRQVGYVEIVPTTWFPLVGSASPIEPFSWLLARRQSPTGKRYDQLNAYDVIASLVNISDAQRLRALSIHPQKVRSEHVHRGELAAGELVPMFMSNHFQDRSIVRRDAWSTIDYLSHVPYRMVALWGELQCYPCTPPPAIRLRLQPRRA